MKSKFTISLQKTWLSMLGAALVVTAPGLTCHQAAALGGTQVQTPATGSQMTTGGYYGRVQAEQQTGIGSVGEINLGEAPVGSEGLVVATINTAQPDAAATVALSVEANASGIIQGNQLWSNGTPANAAVNRAATYQVTSQGPSGTSAQNTVETHPQVVHTQAIGDQGKKQENGSGLKSETVQLAQTHLNGVKDAEVIKNLTTNADLADTAADELHDGSRGRAGNSVAATAVRDLETPMIFGFNPAGVGKAQGKEAVAIVGQPPVHVAPQSRVGFEVGGFVDAVPFLAAVGVLALASLGAWALATIKTLAGPVRAALATGFSLFTLGTLGSIYAYSYYGYSQEALEASLGVMAGMAVVSMLGALAGALLGSLSRGSKAVRAALGIGSSLFTLGTLGSIYAYSYYGYSQEALEASLGVMAGMGVVSVLGALAGALFSDLLPGSKAPQGSGSPTPKV